MAEPPRRLRHLRFKEGGGRSRPRPRPLRFKTPQIQVWGFSYIRVTACVTLVGGFATCAFMAIKLPVLGPVLVTMFTLPFLLFGFRRLWGVGEPSPKLLALAPDPAPGESFPVRVVLRRSGKPLIDDALLTFVDGWLHVEGLRTSFSLRACDVGELTERGSVLTLGLPDEQRVLFRSSRCQR